MPQSKAIGGYFEWEFGQNQGQHYHNGAIRLNTARCAFEYVLRAKGYKKVFLPYYTCDVMMEPIEKLGIEVEFYHIDSALEPIFDQKIAPFEAFVYTNYFGVKQQTVERLSQCINNLIVDNAQAFFAPPIPGVDTIYSARKFFGLPDGAYLYTDTIWNEELLQDTSFGRVAHLLKRLELGSEAGYADFCAADQSLVGQPIKTMSVMTQRVIEGVDYEHTAKQRANNFLSLHQALGQSNRLKLSEPFPAMVYPYWSDQAGLRNLLISERVFVARYWPNVVEWCGADQGVEADLVEHLLPLPIDQRYGEQDMERIINILRR